MEHVRWESHGGSRKEESGVFGYTGLYRGVHYMVEIFYGRPSADRRVEYHLIIENPRDGRGGGRFEVPPFEDPNKTGFDSLEEALAYAEQLFRSWQDNAGPET